MSNACIYCASGGPFSDEHVVPACLGEFRDFPLLQDTVCKTCNNDIGRAEEQFCRCGPEAFFRQYLGICGRGSHEKVNPFERGSAGGPPIDFTALDPATGLTILWEFNPGQQTIREVRQIVLIAESGTIHPMRIPANMRDTEQLRTAIRACGLGKIQEVRVFAAPDEMAWLEALVKPLGQQFAWKEAVPPGEIRTGGEIRFGLSTPYFRAVAKIGFHYLLSVCRHVRGCEPEFSAIREFVRHGGKDAQFVSQKPGLLVGFNRGKGLEPPCWYTHMLAVEWKCGVLCVKAQFFLGPNFVPPVNVVKIAEGASTFKGQGRLGHVLQYFPNGKQGRFSGIAQRIHDAT